MPQAAKITLWVIGVLSVMATAFYQIENWKGRVALKEILAEIKADGEPMTVDELPGTPPPDEENFFKAPLVSSLIDYEVKYSKSIIGNLEGEVIYAQPNERERLLAMRLPELIRKYGYYLPETGTKGLESKEKGDFEAWAEVFRLDPKYVIPDESNADDSALVLAAINSRFANEWKELNEAVSRSQSFYQMERDISFDQRFSRPIPIYNDWLTMSKFLNLRISAAIEERDFQTFREAVQIYIQFEKGIGNGTILISNLVLSASHSILLGTLWNGLNSKSFPENDLQWIANKLRELDLRIATLNAYRGGRMLFTQPYFEKAKRSAKTGGSLLKTNSVLGESPKYLNNIISTIVPDGWWDQNSAALQRFNHHEFVSRWTAMDFSGAKGIDGRSPKGSNPYTVLAHSSSLGLVSVNERFMHIYVMNQLAILACEIEIYALKHGNYPDTLAELVPSQLKNIPLDPFDGKPMKYRKVDDRYLIYSVGLNETDEHGKVIYRRPGRINKKSGDWVWDYREVEKRDNSEQRMKFLDAIRKEIDPDYEAQAPEFEKRKKRKISALQKRNLENAKRRIKEGKEKLRKK